MLAEDLLGVGAMVKDEWAKVILVVVQRFRSRWSVALAEAMATRVGNGKAIWL